MSQKEAKASEPGKVNRPSLRSAQLSPPYQKVIEGGYDLETARNCDKKHVIEILNHFVTIFFDDFLSHTKKPVFYVCITYTVLFVPHIYLIGIRLGGDSTILGIHGPPIPVK